MTVEPTSATLSALADRLSALEAKEAIRALKFRYAELCDSGYDGHAIAELFTEDATWASNLHGPFRGRDEIAGFMETAGRDAFAWAVHYMTNPQIEVDVRTGRGRAQWLLLQLSSRRGVDDAHEGSAVSSGAYDDRLVLTEDGWRFASVSLTFGHITDLRRGWPAAELLPPREGT